MPDAAREVLLTFVLGNDVPHHVSRVVTDFVPRIEAEAVANERQRIAAAVDSTLVQHIDDDGLHWVRYSDVLRIVEGEPTLPEEPIPAWDYETEGFGGT